MLVADAKAVARQWVEEERPSIQNFHGAYLAGSMTCLPDNASLPDASDIDIKVILDLPDVLADPRKLVYSGAILDVSYGPVKDVASPEAILGSYFTAVHFAHPSILSDPTGRLSQIQAVVASDYPKREWVRRRCQHARQTLETTLTGWDTAGSMKDAVSGWLFASVFLPPMVLVADLQNPTHRRGMANLLQVLTRYGHRELHERVLDAVGIAGMSQGDVERLFAACAEAYDAATTILQTPFMLASNIRSFARPIAIGGGQELIAEGFHREAMVWIAFIHTLCHTAFANDAPEDMRARFAPGYQHLLTALGVSTLDQLAERKQMIGQLIPDLWSVVEEIIDANPAIRDS